MTKNKYSLTAVLGMLALWALNNDLARTEWINEIWHDNPHLMKHFTDKYLGYIDGCNGNECMVALVRFIANLDYENGTRLASAVIAFAEKEFSHYIKYCRAEGDLDMADRV